MGAVIEHRLCLDLTTQSGVEQIRVAHFELLQLLEKAGQKPPRNHADGRRNLDCAMIRYLHEVRTRDQAAPIDTVKAIFIEGGPVYEGSGFNDKTHVQICVRNPDCIKGVFRVPQAFLT